MLYEPFSSYSCFCTCWLHFQRLKSNQTSWHYSEYKDDGLKSTNTELPPLRRLQARRCLQICSGISFTAESSGLYTSEFILPLTWSITSLVQSVQRIWFQTFFFKSYSNWSFLFLSVCDWLDVGFYQWIPPDFGLFWRFGGMIDLRLVSTPLRRFSRPSICRACREVTREKTDNWPWICCQSTVQLLTVGDDVNKWQQFLRRLMQHASIISSTSSASFLIWFQVVSRLQKHLQSCSGLSAFSRCITTYWKGLMASRCCTEQTHFTFNP